MRLLDLQVFSRTELYVHARDVRTRPGATPGRPA
jgi:hypothetical protein